MRRNSKLLPNHANDSLKTCVNDAESTNNVLTSHSLPADSDKPRRSWLRDLGIVLGVGMTAVASAIAGTYVALFVPLPEEMAPQETAQNPALTDLLRKGVRHTITRPINILVMGIDRVPGADVGDEALFSGRSDTMLLVQVNPDDQSVRMLSIPRDTQVSFPGVRGVSKINHANAIGGPRLAADVVSHNLNDIPIDRYVRFSTDAFRELVDVLEGVEIFVPSRMYYVDRTQDLTIDLEQGLQVLDGAEAEQFARFRGDANGDIGRVQRQQLLIHALRDRFISPSMIPRIPQVLQLLDTHIDTNLSSEELLALATFGLDIQRDSLQMVMLPGTFSTRDEYVASYWLMDDAGVSRILDSYFGVSPVTYASDQNRLDDFRSDDFRSGEVTNRQVGRSLSGLRIAVQNASTTPQVARQVVGYLREQGLTQVYAIQDWPEHQTQTQIIVQNGHLRGAEALEDVLGIGRVIPASTGDLGSDLTIRVGDDWVQRSEIELYPNVEF
ncbi:MAG: LCP family protein [Cyanobacteria bacterium P01_E01_bin.6]